jgi:hypothetical protein
MGLDVSDDGKDSIISVGKERNSTPEEKVVLVYPYVVADNIDKASKGLHLGEQNSKYSLSQLLQLQQQKEAPRSHFVTMYQSDLINSIQTST